MPSRRDVLLGVGSAGLAASAGCLGSDDVEPGTDDSYGWTTGGADLRNSRAIPDGVAPREAPTLEWRADLESVHATGEPIVTDETVLLTTGTDVVAFDRETGGGRSTPRTRPTRIVGRQRWSTGRRTSPKWGR